MKAKECEKACLYLLEHCYEETKNGDDTYNFTPSGFKESEVFKQLIEEHFEMLDKIKTGELSDGYHTFNELYYHRAVLFSIICNEHKDIAYKSKKHHDGTMYDGMFIVGINTPQGQYSYHYDLNMWSMFDLHEFEFAPEWDGHKPSDIEILRSINNPNPYKFEDLKVGMWVWDNQLKWCFEIAICKVEIKGCENLKMFKVKNYDDSLTLMIFEENRFFPVQMANVRCEKDD